MREEEEGNNQEMHYENHNNNNNSTGKVVIREYGAVCGTRSQEPEQKMKQRFWRAARGGGSESGPDQESEWNHRCC
ncbi:uncharacterized protein P174DRAFT_441638 [Aspergillus novofumigatus IBT 16806]|uniref:Uncharacterized protein n=1 Tax=Aspergillus novofumigatus (strain IBT 16806) TaxID=1392255 RepID=A0A2I1C9P2_ASPN1|nr:uncharacterized protein P174DRAFT_441638 [Aspergillus novofumigatus IBT 16806]PKX94350.1 hypothetical protein P174DRAFT_441638 [Aspergillus novofumigatus IBT 16806]